MKIEMRDPLRELLDSLAGKLKADGFKRKGFTFCKKTDDLFFIINWQKSRDDISGHQKFTVNIGISTGKLLAKMASDFKKPNQVHTLYQNEIEKKMWPLPVNDLLPLKCLVNLPSSSIFPNFENSKLPSLNVSVLLAILLFYPNFTAHQLREQVIAKFF